MNKLSVLIGIVLGVVFSAFAFGIAFKVAAPTMFFKEVKSTYAFDKTVDLIKNRINAKDGWHVTTIIDSKKRFYKMVVKMLEKLKLSNFVTLGYLLKC